MPSTFDSYELTRRHANAGPRPPVPAASASRCGRAAVLAVLAIAGAVLVALWVLAMSGPAPPVASSDPTPDVPAEEAPQLAQGETPGRRTTPAGAEEAPEPSWSIEILTLARTAPVVPDLAVRVGLSPCAPAPRVLARGRTGEDGRVLLSLEESRLRALGPTPLSTPGWRSEAGSDDRVP